MNIISKSYEVGQKTEIIYYEVTNVPAETQQDRDKNDESVNSRYQLFPPVRSDGIK